MNLVVIGLSITSSWGNGHATTFRSLLREFAARGHRITFLERDVPWYAPHRDLTECDYCKIILYQSLKELRSQHGRLVRNADAVIVGSYVPDGIEVGEWVVSEAKGITAFYDIDTPVTLAKLRAGDCSYLSAPLIQAYDLYLSFTGGKTLVELEEGYGSPCARAFYCSVDPALYRPLHRERKWDLGYLGTYSDDRQPSLDRLLILPARAMEGHSFVVAGPQYPAGIKWPSNVGRIEHLPPPLHCDFYNSQRFTLNITRADMIAAGYSPSVRLFEAAACAVPIISDWWEGLDTLLEPDREILIAASGDDVISMLEEISPDRARQIGAAASRRILAGHTAAHRAAELETHLLQLRPEPALKSVS